MPHAPKHATQHCAVRNTMRAIVNGCKRRAGPRRCEAALGCTVERLVQRLGFHKGDKRQLDHIVPLSRGGTHHFTNYRLLSPRTHMHRGSHDATPEERAAVALLELRYTGTT